MPGSIGRPPDGSWTYPQRDPASAPAVPTDRIREEPLMTPRASKLRYWAGVPALAFAGLLLAILPVPVRAQDTLRLARLDGPMSIDGRVDEPEWEGVPVLPLTQYAPQYGAEPSKSTEIRVAYDDAYLYVSGRMYDPVPDGVRANTLYRDAYAGDDLMCALFDTYHDRQSAAWFCVNPAGSRIDQISSGDGTSLNIDWNTYWDVAATRDERGWFAEMRIPFSSLGFQDEAGRVVMGLEVYRYVRSTNERLVYPDIPPAAGGYVKPSRMHPVLLEGVHRRTPAYVTPYVLGGWQRQTELNEAGSAFDRTSDYRRETGLDVRYSPSPSLSLDFTANTDFAQVEADDQQINLTRFPLFLPEKRQFFQERSSIFDFGLGGLSRLFHSRRIGLVEGQPIRILGGGRAVGRSGGTDFGFLSMQTAEELGLPSENFTVARVRQRAFNAYSTVGGMVTSRTDFDGSYNVAAGVDAFVRVVGDEYVTAKLAHTSDSEIDGSDWLDATRVLFRWERRTEGGLAYTGEVARSGAAFVPGVGFDLRSDFTSLDGDVEYLWFTSPSSPFRAVSISANTGMYRRNPDGSTESALVAPGAEIEFNSGTSIAATYRATYESVRSAFPLAPDVAVLPGDYWFHEGELSFQAGRTTAFRPSVSVAAGQFYDGHRVEVAASPSWNPSPHLELSGTYSFNAIRFPDRDLAVDLHLLRLRFRAAYDTHLSLSTFIQYNSLDDLTSLNARLRYNIRDGNDLWIVYDEAINTDRHSYTPVPPVSRGRAVMLKYTHTLLW
jgi:hypothetical protein